MGFQGADMQATVNRVLHWNGHSWSRVTAPNPGGSASDDESRLAAVRCLTAKNCWAVGDTYHNDTQRNQVLHWNGKRWSQVHVVNPGGTKSGDRNGLLAVRCGSARNCNAAGYYGQNVAPQRNEVLHWNGTRWSHVSAPNPAGTGSSAANDLQALACGSGTNCWAGGYASIGKTHNQMLHWNGLSWTKATVPNSNANTPLVDDELRAATCSSTRNCWAVGQQGILGSTAIMNEALHWNGKHWSLVKTPNPGGTGSPSYVSRLLGVRCTSASSCWAVGEQSHGGVFHQEILFWNGGKWTVF